VISGFVIASSIRGEIITPGFFGRFVLRRSLRLDPPYWATIVLEIALIAVSRRLLHDAVEYPSPPQLAAHVAYAQGILGFDHIVAVFWTLCIEVQLYLLFVLLVGFAQRIPGERGLALVFAPTVAASLLSPLYFSGVAKNVYFVPYWHLFCAGVFVRWTLDRQLSAPWLMAYVAWSAATLATEWRSITTVVALAAVCSIWLAGRCGKLSVWLGGPILQWLGRISYSLYLVHLPVCGRAISYISHHMAAPLDRGRQLALLAAGLAISLLAAQLLYVCVERPSLRLSKRFRKHRELPTATTQV
jgi:peptidoglycan/LPS O-acetylase OafA/YrhL